MKCNKCRYMVASPEGRSNKRFYCAHEAHNTGKSAWRLITVGDREEVAARTPKWCPLQGGRIHGKNRN